MTRPNIVLILSDDQGNWAMNCAGNQELIFAINLKTDLVKFEIRH